MLGINIIHEQYIERETHKILGFSVGKITNQHRVPSADRRVGEMKLV